MLDVISSRNKNGITHEIVHLADFPNAPSERFCQPQHENQRDNRKEQSTPTHFGTRALLVLVGLNNIFVRCLGIVARVYDILLDVVCTVSERTANVFEDHTKNDFQIEQRHHVIPI